MLSHEELLREAVRLARTNLERGGRPFGAVLAIDGEIVANGVNDVVHSHDPTTHAEMEAVRAASRRLGRPNLQGGVVYASGHPCPMCLAAIHWAKLDKVHYAMTRHDAAAIGFADAAIYEAMTAPQAPLLHTPNAAAKAAFAAWQAKPDRIRY